MSTAKNDTNMEAKHPDYERMAEYYQRNEEIYDGGMFMESVVKGKNKYLTQHPLEKDKQYAIRCERASYRNYAAPTVDLFASSVLNGASRESLDKMAALEPVLQNCDRTGQSPDQFFKAVVTRSAAVGARFVLVDMPTTDSPALTLAEAREKGLHPYFVPIAAQNLIAWKMGVDRKLDFFVYVEERADMPEPFKEAIVKKYLHVWRREEGKVIWQRYESAEGGQYREVGSGAFDVLSEIPLVPFLYERETDMTGRSVTDDVASLIVRVFNADSELDKMLFDAAVPITYVVGITPDEADDVEKATSNIWAFKDTNCAIHIVEPSGASFVAKREQIQGDIESIREISLRQTKPKTAGVETAEAKRLDAVQLSSQLADFARNAAMCEARCWKFAAQLAGASESEIDSIVIEYNETFDPDSLRERLTGLFVELRKGGDISRNRLLRQIGLTEDEIAENDAELEQEERQGQGISGEGIGDIVGKLLSGSRTHEGA